ncbi:MAG TPA: hypothetical protein DCM73_04275 [Clostridiales bacterium]|nr:hypothetical protein [Clostridiales bacterium]
MIDYGLKDKVVLITGTNNPKGIGAATAFSFAKQGAKVAILYKKIYNITKNLRQETVLTLTTNP